MIYRGVEFRLVQSIAPKGWRWSFEYAGRQRSGHKSHREDAFVQMKRSIDQAIRRYDGPQLPPAKVIGKGVTVPGTFTHRSEGRPLETPTD
jgi:hypothetical protein